MKILVTIPTMFAALVIAMLMNSCGSSPEQEESARPLAPPIQQNPVSFEQAAIPVNPALPVANRVAGRPGFVFNPYNQNMVEVSGLSSGTKARDPQDPDPSHIFVIP